MAFTGLRIQTSLGQVLALTAEKRREYEGLLKKRLSEGRYKHSLAVAKEAVRLAERYGADAEKAEVAGLLHDIMKEADRDEQLSWTYKAIRRPDDIMLATRKLLHAPAGAAYCRRELGIRDREVLGAIRWHTTAREGMTLLEKVIYLADFTGEDRDYDDVDVMRRLVDKSMAKAMSYALEYTIKDLVAEHRPVHPDTVAAYNELAILGGKHSK